MVLGGGLVVEGHHREGWWEEWDGGVTTTSTATKRGATTHSKHPNGVDGELVGLGVAHLDGLPMILSLQIGGYG